METIAWLVVLVLFYLFAIVPALERWKQKFSAATEGLGTLASEFSEFRRNGELSLRELHRKHDALIEALARIDDAKEMPFLKTHYDLILQLLTLRDRGTPEEAIVKEHMNFRPIDGFGAQGWRVPIYDKEKSKWTLWRFSPYYVATNHVRIHALTELLEQAREQVHPDSGGGPWRTLASLAVSTRQFDKEQFPGAEERDAIAYYKDSAGKDREWPERIAQAKA